MIQLSFNSSVNAVILSHITTNAKTERVPKYMYSVHTLS